MREAQLLVPEDSAQASSLPSRQVSDAQSGPSKSRRTVSKSDPQVSNVVLPEAEAV